jgi:hypothetical protein
MYIAIWDDRHTDTTAHLFTEQKAAVDWAKKTAKECLRFPEDWFEYWEDAPETDVSSPWSPAAVEEGFIYSVTYSCESDSISVMKIEVDKELAST